MIYRIVFPLFLLVLTMNVSAQKATDHDMVSAACLNYIEGFYQGDTSKLVEALSPRLHKFGYWKNDKTGDFGEPIYMTYTRALEYALDVLNQKNFAKPDAPKAVEVLDIMDHIAAAKVTAWWGYDYMLLSKESGKWQIVEVLWQGPYKDK